MVVHTTRQVSRTTFWFVEHTHTDKNVENIIPAFAVTAGKSGNANLYSPLKWQMVKNKEK